MDLKKNGIFVPIMAVFIYLLLRVFEWIGLNSSQGYILQLILIVYLFVYVKDHFKTTTHKTLIILGGVFCLIGDMFLAGAFNKLLISLDLSSFRMPFGMLGFFVGNILWFTSLWLHKDNFSLKRFFIVFSIFSVGLILLWFLTVYTKDNLLLSILALVYCFCLGLNISYGIANIKVNKSYKFLVIGYAVFIFSDLWIGMNDIKGINMNDFSFNQSSFVIWVTYILALSFISYFHVSYKKDANDSK